MSNEMLSIIAIVISIAGVLLSSLLYRNEINNMKFSDSNEIFITLDQVMIQYPETRPYFYDNQPIGKDLDSVERDRILLIAELMLDAGEWIVDKHRGMGRKNEAAQKQYVLDCLCNSAVMRQHVSEHPTWHPHVAEIAREAKL